MSRAAPIYKKYKAVWLGDAADDEDKEKQEGTDDAMDDTTGSDQQTDSPTAHEELMEEKKVSMETCDVSSGKELGREQKDKDSGRDAVEQMCDAEMKTDTLKNDDLQMHGALKEPGMVHTVEDNESRKDEETREEADVSQSSEGEEAGVTSQLHDTNVDIKKENEERMEDHKTNTKHRDVQLDEVKKHLQFPHGMCITV